MARLGPIPGIRVPQIVALFLIVDIGLGVAYLVNYLTGGYIGYSLNLNSENSIGTWYSSMQLFCISAVATVSVYGNLTWRNKRSWALVGLPLVFLFLSIDEAVHFHEWLGLKSDAFLPEGDRTETAFQNTGIWVFLMGVPFLVCFLLWAYSIRRFFAISPGSFSKLVVGMLILLLGALGFELLTNFWRGGHSVGYVSVTLCEETLEMLGMTVILWGAYDLATKFIVMKKLTCPPQESVQASC
jgi:hypothetical protein